MFKKSALNDQFAAKIQKHSLTLYSYCETHETSSFVLIQLVSPHLLQAKG
jgi:hypothetical protein